MIEDWIDVLCKVWEIGYDQKTVKSYKLLGQTDFPTAIVAADLAQRPIALTIPASVQPYYSKGHKHLTWFGVTEFHVAPDLDKGRLPSLILWYERILKAAALKVQLSGTTANIANFVVEDRPDGIQGPLALQYGDETPHWGFIVNWKVEEGLAGNALPVSG